jgi:hypothetical protein
MIDLVLVYPEPEFFYYYLPSERETAHKRQKERKTRRNNRLPDGKKAKQPAGDCYF